MIYIKNINIASQNKRGNNLKVNTSVECIITHSYGEGNVIELNTTIHLNDLPQRIKELQIEYLKSLSNYMNGNRYIEEEEFDEEIESDIWQSRILYR